MTTALRIACATVLALGIAMPSTAAFAADTAFATPDQPVALEGPDAGGGGGSPASDPELAEDERPLQLFAEPEAPQPLITTQPLSAWYSLRTVADALVVAAELPPPSGAGEESTLSYQWYTNDEKSSVGASPVGEPDETSLIPDTTSTGIRYYFCAVTHSYEGGEETVLSTIVTIAVLDGIPAKPAIAAEPEDSFVKEGITPEAPLAVVATQEPADPGITAQGTLTYQWYSNSTGLSPTLTGIPADVDKAIDGATDASYAPVAQGRAGDKTWYYCIVSVSFGDLAAESVVSRAALITLTPTRVISNPKDLLDFAREVNGTRVVDGETLPANNFSGKTVVLADDIDLSTHWQTAHNWTSIGLDGAHSFNGIFEGGGRTISGLSYSGGWRGVYTGLFGRTAGATLRNFKLEGTVAYTSGGSNAPTALLLATDAGSSSLSNIEIEGSIHFTQEGTDAAQALEYIALGVGQRASTTRLTAVITKGSLTIEGNYYASYIAGIAAGYLGSPSLIDCGNEATITITSTSSAPQQYISGVGSFAGTYTRCYNTGDISVAGASASPNNIVAGISAGMSMNLSHSFRQCYNTGDITSPYYAGGITAGGNNERRIIDCYNAGSITSSYGSIGSAVAVASSGNVDAYSGNNHFLEGSVSGGQLYFAGTPLSVEALASPEFIALLNHDGIENYVLGTSSPRLIWELGSGAPVITGQTTDPESGRIMSGGEPETVTLFVSASPPTDEQAPGFGGRLSYQWYRAPSALNNYGVEIQGADEDRYEWTPEEDDEPGWHYFYCVATNTWNTGTGERSASTTSSIFPVALVTVAADKLWTPSFDEEPRDTWYIRSDGDRGTPALRVQVAEQVSSAEAVVGEIGYQWYANTAESTADATKLWGETEASFSPPITDNGTTYYFCEVTNTFEGANTALATSAIARAVVWDYETAAPVITVGPASAQYLKDAGDATPLSVTAHRPEPPATGSDGTLSYQWYYNTEGTALSTDTDTKVGTDSPTVMPDTSLELDSYYYYCVITNTVAIDNPKATHYPSSTTEYARVDIVSETEVAKPVVDSSQLQANASYLQNVAPEPLIVTAGFGEAVTGFDTPEPHLSYTWYYNTTGISPEGDRPSEGDIRIDLPSSATYTPPATTTLGTRYYYCLVTNTFEKVKTASTASELAAITIEPVLKIYTAEELRAFADSLLSNPSNHYDGLTVTLEANLDLEGNPLTDPWTPIGSSPNYREGLSTDKSFTGTFDGRGHTISGLHTSLFGAVKQGATIENLVVQGSITSSAERVSGLVDTLIYSSTRPAATIRNVGSEMDIISTNTAGSTIGGIIASNSSFWRESVGLHIEGCYYRATMLAYPTASTSGSTGGIIGYAGGDISLRNCYNEGYIAGAGSVGGIIGHLSQNTDISLQPLVFDCYNCGSVEYAAGGDQERVGALAGRVDGLSGTRARLSNLFYLEGSCWQGSSSGSSNFEVEASSIQALSSSALGSAAQVTALNGTQSPAPWVAGEPYPALAWEHVAVPEPNILTITVDSFAKDYGDTDPVLTYTTRGLVDGDTLSGLSITRAPGEKVGSYNITASNAVIEGDGKNPAASYYIVYKTGSLTINPAPLTITVDSKEKISGKADPAFTYRVSDCKGTDKLTSLSVARTRGETPGSYNITARAAVIQNGNLNVTANYLITYIQGTLTIHAPDDEDSDDEDPDDEDPKDEDPKDEKPPIPPERDWPRLDGNKGDNGGRYDTMQAIVNEGWKDTGSPYVIVASGGNFPDALAASSLAGIYDAPVVLTATDTLTPQAEETIRSLKASRAYVIGGPAAVSDATLTLLETVVGAG
ncbi:MAG: cell wall-binding repeat-containing protein, partial [Coriobacteriales bacterium]|nr:cell wall-binding repeat-containing protein [Coriobacteriales bacterium]